MFQNSTVPAINVAEKVLKDEKQKLVELQLRDKALDDQLQHIIETQPKTTSDRLNEHARNLLNNKPSNPQDFDHIEGQKQEIYNQRRVTKRAIEIQREVINSAQRQLGLATKEKLFPKYRECIRKTAAAAVELSRLVTLERQIREGFMQSTLLSANMLGHPGIFTKVGELHDPNSKIVAYLKEMHRVDYLTDDDFAELRKY